MGTGPVRYSWLCRVLVDEKEVETPMLARTGRRRALHAWVTRELEMVFNPRAFPDHGIVESGFGCGQGLVNHKLGIFEPLGRSGNVFNLCCQMFGAAETECSEKETNENTPLSIDRMS